MLGKLTIHTVGTTEPMKATAHNTHGQCERCKSVKYFVMGVAFQGDGTATFRHLCASCERIERGVNQPRLFKAVTYATVEEAVEAVEEIAPRRDERQMGLFTSDEMRGY